MGPARVLRNEAKCAASELNQDLDVGQGKFLLSQITGFMLVKELLEY